MHIYTVLSALFIFNLIRYNKESNREYLLPGYTYPLPAQNERNEIIFLLQNLYVRILFCFTKLYKYIYLKIVKIKRRRKNEKIIIHFDDRIRFCFICLW